MSLPTWWVALWRRLARTPGGGLLVWGDLGPVDRQQLATEGWQPVSPVDQGECDGLAAFADGWQSGADALRPGGLFLIRLDGDPATVERQRRAIGGRLDATVHLLDPESADAHRYAFGWRGRRLPDPSTARRVLLVTHRHGLAAMGGGETLLIETLVHLVAENVHADIGLSPAAGQGYDLVHLFSLRFGDQVAALQACPVQIVATPLFWDHRELWLASRIIGTAAAKSPSLAAFDEVLHRWRSGRLDVGRLQDQGDRDWAQVLAFHRPALQAASALLVGSAGEGRMLERLYGEAVPPCHVVALGARPERFVLPPTGRPTGDRVLCVGRIEPRKNQLLLIRALREMDWPLTLVGPVGNPEYAALCRRWAGRQVEFRGDEPDVALLDHLRSHPVHALPSWFELPGLATIEAGMAGCSLVVGDRGAEPEVFAGMARTCDPADWSSIAAAVARASQEQGNGAGVARYTWERTAAATAAVYEGIWGRG